MASLKLQGSTSGEITIAAPAVAGTNTLTLPANTGNIITTGDSGTITQGMIGSGVASTGPSFHAYRNSAQTLTFTGGYIKVIFNTEAWDTNSCYDTSTGLFTPTVAGYYQLNAYVQITTPVSQHGGFYKNGSGWNFGSNLSNSTDFGSQNSTIVYLNGTTDYVAYYLYVASTVNTATTATCWFNGALLRAAS